MVDIGGVRGFQWDAGNARKSELRHGVTQGEAEQVFLNEPLILSEDTAHSGEEARFQALGRTQDGRRLQIAFTFRNQGRLIRVISARDMSRSERERHDTEA
jgi:hypothetical protein